MAMEIDEAVIRVDNHAEIDEVEPIEISDAFAIGIASLIHLLYICETYFYRCFATEQIHIDRNRLFVMGCAKNVVSE